MSSPRTIAIAYASVGSGHRVAAEAIAAELSKRSGDVRVELLDVLDYASPKISGNLLSSTFSGPTAGIYDAAWRSTAFGAVSRTLSAPTYALLFKGFRDAISELSPDAVVCTHAAPAVIASREVDRHGAGYSVVSVATDFGVHGYWPRAGVAVFCVADEGSAEALRARGFDESVIATTGLPVRSQFTLEYDRVAARRHFGLPTEHRIVLALAGSKMPGPYTRFKEALAVALPAIASLPNTSLALVAGTDTAYAEDMKARAKGFGATNVHVFGYVEHMAALMSCADLGLAKAGGGISGECVASTLPLVLVGPAVGQEGANARALTEAGVASFCADPRLIAEATRKVLSKPPKLKAMREAAQRIARPFATADITDRVLALVGEVPETPRSDRQRERITSLPEL